MQKNFLAQQEMISLRPLRKTLWPLRETYFFYFQIGPLYSGDKNQNS